MARNGSGTWVRLYDWTDDALNNIPISSTRMDAETDDMANGLTQSVSKDGQTTLTGDLPMGTHKLTALAAGSARTDSINTAQVQDGGVLWFGTTGGSTTAYTASLSPAITAYATGQKFRGLCNASNTASCTLNLNGVGAKTIKRVAENLSASDLLTNEIFEVVYDGTNFQLLSPSSKTLAKAWGTITGTTSPTVTGYGIGSINKSLGTGKYTLAGGGVSTFTAMVATYRSTGATITQMVSFIGGSPDKTFIVTALDGTTLQDLASSCGIDFIAF